ncbi:uncharacterized protein METZ01_LOCUS397167, partial [marine metagenome]
VSGQPSTNILQAQLFVNLPVETLAGGAEP